MNYRSISQLNSDLGRWRDALPPVDLIVGVPRSGMLAAELLALQAQVPVTDVDGLIEGRTMRSGLRLGSSADLLREPRTVLVVDDSVDSGKALEKVRSEIRGAGLSHTVLYGAVYVSPQAVDLVDYFYEVIPQPRVFDWNVLHHPMLLQSCMDIDGVLCRDPSEIENDDGPEYARFIQTVAARYVPTVEVGWLVTGRLERYRPETEAWLVNAGVRFRQLIMHPAKTGEERRALGNHAAFKADVYRKTGAWLFLESSELQAREIARLARRPVYCIDTFSLVRPTDVAPGIRSTASEAYWRSRNHMRHRAREWRRRLATMRSAHAQKR